MRASILSAIHVLNSFFSLALKVLNFKRGNTQIEIGLEVAGPFWNLNEFSCS